jgi:hypothetical protein
MTPRKPLRRSSLLPEAVFQADGLAAHLAGDFVIAIHQTQSPMLISRLGVVLKFGHSLLQWLNQRFDFRDSSAA